MTSCLLMPGSRRRPSPARRPPRTWRSPWRSPPLAWENFDIVLSADALQAAEPLIAALRQAAVRSAVDALGGYDLAQSGAVQLLDLTTAARAGHCELAGSRGA